MELIPVIFIIILIIITVKPSKNTRIARESEAVIDEVKNWLRDYTDELSEKERTDLMFKISDAEKIIHSPGMQSILQKEYKQSRDIAINTRKELESTYLHLKNKYGD